MLVLLRQFITHNGILKAFSLMLAILMWFAIWSGSNDQISRIVPIGFRDIPANMEITGETDIQVTLQLRGSFDLLAELSSSDITAAISLAGDEPGHKVFTITRDNVDTPTGVEVFGINPDRVEFNLERTIRKDVEIQARVEGDPADGFIVDEAFVTPARMLIEGPQSSVDAIEVLSTVPVRIDGSTDSISTSVNLDVPDAMVRLGSFAPVEVFVQIVEIPAVLSFEVQPGPSLIEAWDMDADVLEVTVRGPASQIDAFDPEGVHFEFDAVSVGEDGTVVPELVGLPDDFSVIERSPASLRVSPSR